MNSTKICFKFSFSASRTLFASQTLIFYLHHHIREIRLTSLSHTFLSYHKFLSNVFSFPPHNLLPNLPSRNPEILKNVNISSHRIFNFIIKNLNGIFLFFCVCALALLPFSISLVNWNLLFITPLGFEGKLKKTLSESLWICFSYYDKQKKNFTYRFLWWS